MKLICFTTATLALLLIEGCSGYSNPDEIVFPADSVSYAKQVEPYFALACNSSGCHNSLDAADNVDLSSWTGIRNSPDVVGVGNPYDTTCTLYLVMFGKVLHNAPINANENQRDGIKTWIMEGAQDN